MIAITAIAEEIFPMSFSFEGYPSSYFVHMHLSHRANRVLEHAKWELFFSQNNLFSVL